MRAAYERVEATARDYAGDLTRAADALRREIDAERAREMDEIEEMKREVLRAKDLLERERLDFDARRAMQEDELTRAYDALQDEREAFERERSRVEGEKIKFETEVRAHEKYAKIGGSMRGGVRTSSYAPSHSFAGEDADAYDAERAAEALKGLTM